MGGEKSDKMREAGSWALEWVALSSYIKEKKIRRSVVPDGGRVEMKNYVDGGKLHIFHF